MTHPSTHGTETRGRKQTDRGRRASTAGAARPGRRRAVTCSTKRYELFERLGVGGMATVHRAIEHGDDGSQRAVALKRLLPHLAEDRDFVRAFIREAQLAARLDHPGIVRIYKLGRGATGYFISMELITGSDLAGVLQLANRVAGPPPIGVVVALLTELCAALDYAHRRTDRSGRPLGLIHRDVSPANLIVDRSGHLKIIDFGIAKASASNSETQTGLLKGKFAYMAPEAGVGSSVDARSDIFSAGVVAHELLTARPLFAGSNDYETMKNVQRAEVNPPSQHNSCCPPDLDAIVIKALERDPDQRWQSMAEMGAALAEVKAARSSADDVAEWLRLARSIQSSRPDIDLVLLDSEVLGDEDDDGDDDDVRTCIFRSPSQADCPAEDEDEDEDEDDAAALAGTPGRGESVLSKEPLSGEERHQATLQASSSGWRKFLLAAAIVLFVAAAALIGPRLGFAPATASEVTQEIPAETAAPLSPPTVAEPLEGPPPAPTSPAGESTDEPVRAPSAVADAPAASRATSKRKRRRRSVSARASARVALKGAPAGAAGNVVAPLKLDIVPPRSSSTSNRPQVVPSAKVERLSGRLPVIRKRASVPPRVSAKLCIDRRGKVTSVTVLGEVVEDISRELEASMSRWRYRPYRLEQDAVPVCFAISFRTRTAR